MCSVDEIDDQVLPSDHLIGAEQMLTGGRGVPDDDAELLARIAHRSYIDGHTQEQIGREFGMSRPKVQRLLDRARQAGVVQFHIAAPADLHLDLESRLEHAYGLTAAIVAPVRRDPDAQRDAVASAAARYLERRLADDTVVAVSHGRTVGAIPGFFRPPTRVSAVFAAAMGGSMLVDAPTNPNEICRALAERCGGRADQLYAPAYVDTAAARDVLLAQDTVSQTLDTASRADLALVGIGGTDDACTMVRSGCLSPAEIAELRAQGAVGDVLGSYVDGDGRPIEAPHGARLIALPIDALHRIDTVIAVASEPEKTDAIRGALRSGVIDVLIVDETNARAALHVAGAAAEDELVGASATREGDV
jgi:DNA-binding transcriptional regulator LsrR (DeoR family)